MEPTTESLSMCDDALLLNGATLIVDRKTELLPFLFCFFGCFFFAFGLKVFPCFEMRSKVEPAAKMDE